MEVIIFLYPYGSIFRQHAACQFPNRTQRATIKCSTYRKFGYVSLLDFYRSYLPETKYPSPPSHFRYTIAFWQHLPPFVSHQFLEGSTVTKLGQNCLKSTVNCDHSHKFSCLCHKYPTTFVVAFFFFYFFK